MTFLFSTISYIVTSINFKWADLSLGERTFTFTSDGQYSRWFLEASVSAAGEANSLEFVLDGEILPWQSRGSDDREFYRWSGDSGFLQGIIFKYTNNTRKI